MGNGAAKVKFNFTDDTQFVTTPNSGLHFIQGVSEKGTPFKPDKIYNNWAAWKEDYGDLLENNDTPLMVKYLLDGGSSIRFSRVVGYTDAEVPVETEPTLADYVGDSSEKTGFHAFDDFDDSMQLTTFGEYDPDLNTAGANYAKLREDLVYYAWLGTGKKEDLILLRSETPSNPYITFIGGEGVVRDLITGEEFPINPIADILNNITKSDSQYGAWYSYAGPKRGIISRFIKLTDNYGTKARIADLDELADNQINMVISRNGRTMLWGNFSGQVAATQMSQISVVRLIIFLRKTLIPITEEFIDEPNINATWQRLYYVAKPFMDNLVDKNALINYRWEGDQFISDPSQWKINQPIAVQEGKYLVKLFITAISAIREIEINLTLSDYTVEFNVE